jgi:hypothetical protein
VRPAFAGFSTRSVRATAAPRQRGGVWDGSSGLRRDVARRAVKFDPMLYLNNVKAVGNAVRPYVPRKFVRLRKLHVAGFSAIGTPESFNPVVAGHPS